MFKRAFSIRLCQQSQMPLKAARLQRAQLKNCKDEHVFYKYIKTKPKQALLQKQHREEEFSTLLGTHSSCLVPELL